MRNMKAIWLASFALVVLLMTYGQAAGTSYGGKDFSPFLKVNSAGVIYMNFEKPGAYGESDFTEQRRAELVAVKIKERMHRVVMRCELFVDNIGIFEEPAPHIGKLYSKTADTVGRLAAMSEGDDIQEIDLIRAFLYNHAEKVEHTHAGVTDGRCTSFMASIPIPDPENPSRVFSRQTKEACDMVEQATSCLNTAWERHQISYQVYVEREGRVLSSIDGTTRGSHRGVTSFPVFDPREDR